MYSKKHVVMKSMKFYPAVWQTIAFALEDYQLDTESKCIKDLVLRNSFALDMNVSEMNLNIVKISVFDDSGIEHFINDFPGQASIPIKGTHTGLFLKSKGVLSLQPGVYDTFRFYLGHSGNSIVYSDRMKEPADGIRYLDFDIENKLNIKGDESAEAILRFDFAPFEFSRLFSKIKELFKVGNIFTGRLANSLSQ